MSQNPAVLQAARTHFGITELRSFQGRAIQAVLDGRDLVVTMPTGGGKSLIYQLPALLLDGLTLVVSPLIALMKDQVDGLRERGIRATFVNSSIDGPTRRERLEACVRGELDLLFVTPERFRSPLFGELLGQLRITRLAVDEAHCISQWGHDFRPDYHRLGEYRERLGSPPTTALTATATPQVVEDIQRALRLEDPLVLRSGIDRPNLFLACTRVWEAEEKVGILADRVRRMDGPGIVYSTLIRDLEALHTELRRSGIRSLVYHGKLSPDERRRMQERFMSSDRDVVLATNAFGMGVDKADIRFVHHAQIPRTLEAWTQEVGRAGRDGEPAWCELLYFEEDVAIQQNFVNWANPDREYLLGVYETLRAWGERIQTKDLDDLRDELLVKNRGDNRVGISLKWFEVLGVTEGSFETHDLRLARDLEPGELPEFVGSEEKRTGDLQSLLKMVQFANDDDTCRRLALSRHFDLEPEPVPCGGCDVCEPAEAWLERSMKPRPRHAPEVRGDDSSEVPFARGDWVRVGRHYGQVVRVEGSGNRLRLVVEGASDLKRRTVDPRKQRVTRMERD